MSAVPRFAGRDVVSIAGLCRADIDAVLEQARICEDAGRTRLFSHVLDGYLLATIFLEPSTRTRLSFEAAMQRLGGSVISVAEPHSSSLAKGESLPDMVRVVEQYADVIVLRSPVPGAAAEAAAVAAVPVINAGDGTHEHPTQALLDLYTIQKERGRLDGLTVAFAGDLKHGRTVHSLLLALLPYRPTVLTVSPASLALPSDLVEAAEEAGVRVTALPHLEDALHISDVLYMTRVQRERFADEAEYDRLKDAYRLDRETLERVGGAATIMHPLPRLTELADDLDELPTAAYIRQAGNGIWVRQALLGMILGKF